MRIRSCCGESGRLTLSLSRMPDMETLIIAHSGVPVWCMVWLGNGCRSEKVHPIVKVHLSSGTLVPRRPCRGTHSASGKSFVARAVILLRAIKVSLVCQGPASGKLGFCRIDPFSRGMRPRQSIASPPMQLLKTCQKRVQVRCSHHCNVASFCNPAKKAASQAPAFSGFFRL